MREIYIQRTIQIALVMSIGILWLRIYPPLGVFRYLPLVALIATGVLVTWMPFITALVGTICGLMINRVASGGVRMLYVGLAVFTVVISIVTLESVTIIRVLIGR